MGGSNIGDSLERGWIEDHLDGNHGGDYSPKEEPISEGVPYISAICLDEDEWTGLALTICRRAAALLPNGISKGNDVLFAHNGTIGRVAILHTVEDYVILVRQ